MDPLGGAISFRRLAHADLDLMHRWLGADHVARSWGSPPTLDQVTATYAPRIDRAEPTNCYLALLDDRPVGYLQTYLIRDHPDYAALVAAGDGAAGLDLFLGEPDVVGRGLGPRVVRAFLDEVVFAHPE